MTNVSAFSINQIVTLVVIKLLDYGFSGGKTTITTCRRDVKGPNRLSVLSSSPLVRRVLRLKLKFVSAQLSRERRALIEPMSEAL